MTSYGVPTWSWAIPLVVAFITLSGVMVTLIIQWRNFNRQLRSAHALKIAEMRQAWFNDLREAMAKFQSFGVTPNLNHSLDRKFYEHGTRIELFMNPNDPDYQELSACLYRFLSADNQLEKFGANPQYVEVCQRILKREWETLKREVVAAGR